MVANFTYENKDKEIMDFIIEFAYKKEKKVGYYPSFNKIPSILFNDTIRLSINQNRRRYDGKYVGMNSFRIEKGNRIIRDNIKFSSIFEIFLQEYEQLELEEELNKNE